MNSKTKLKIGIYAASILQMGIVAIAGSLSTIGEHFSSYDQTMITNLIAIPCLTVIPVTLLAGILTDYFAKKSLIVFGTMLFLIGGLCPFLLDSFPIILLCRVIFGIGAGLLQVMCPALIAENFEGDERASVQGKMMSAQMLGCALMSVIGGILGSIRWNITFLVYVIGVVSLIGELAFIPKGAPEGKPVRRTEAKKTGHTDKTSGDKEFPWTGILSWLVLYFMFFLVGQVISNIVSYIIADKGLGGAAEGGFCITLLSIGGILMGIFFGKFMAIFKKYTVAFGFLFLAAAYFLITFAPGIIVVYAGSFVSGFAFSTAQPCFTVELAGAAGSRHADKAISLGACTQNLAQFLSPYVTGAMGAGLAAAVGMGNNRSAMVLSAVFSAAMAAVVLVVQATGKKDK